MLSEHSFHSEEQMLPLVHDLLPAILGLPESEVCMIAQAAIGNVIPDVLIGYWFQEPERSITKMTYIDAAVFALLEIHGELTVEELLSYVFLARPTAERTFQKLERLGAVTKSATGSVRISQKHTTRAVEIVAIEFKMRRWRDALGQAIAYRNFADRSYVVLDANQVKVVPEMIAAFIDVQVGLILQRGDELQVIAEATKKPQITSDRVIAAQKLAGALLDGPKLAVSVRAPSPKRR